MKSVAKKRLSIRFPELPTGDVECTNRLDGVFAAPHSKGQTTGPLEPHTTPIALPSIVANH